MVTNTVRTNYMIRMAHLNFFLLIFAIPTVLTYKLENGGQIWALLVAGSSGYDNYRHQADICHAYQILHSHGIPDSNIIVMMADDIAYNENNPRQGVIINHPDGPNVYPGVPKDYIGETVNSTNFLKILTGDAEEMKGIGSGRVIQSGPKDNIFVNFADHGAPGILAFPSDELFASDLEAALLKMIKKKMFSKMVLYVEACESGSMFDNLLPDSTNIFVTTAADPNESSYACYFDEQLQTYLGDVYSVNWMEDTEKENLLRETLHHQFEVVRTKTNTSHVEEYGNLDIGSRHVSEFMGFKETINSRNNYSIPAITDAISSRDVPVAILKQKLKRTKIPAERKELKSILQHLIKKRHFLNTMVNKILKRGLKINQNLLEELHEIRHKLTRQNYICYKNLVTAFSENCFKLSENPYTLEKLYILLNVCSKYKNKQAAVVDAMKKTCQLSGQRITGIK